MSSEVTTPTEGQALLCRIGEHLCAIPLATVVETMRPLPIEPIEGAPRPVLGISIIRGRPTPVIDAGRLLGDRATLADRFITLQISGRFVALAVDGVIGVRALPRDKLHELPPLLRDVTAIDVIGATDAQLLLVLRTARIIPEQLLAAIDVDSPPP